MVIDKNRPLPKHTKLDYWECYAKIVLEELFPDNFCNLRLADKPDLQYSVGSIGIEVTRAEDQEQVEAERLYSYLPYENESKRQRHIERIEQIGAKVQNGFLSGIPDEDNFNRINTAIDRKCTALSKGGYAKFKEYHLFIFSTIYAVEHMLKEELELLIMKNIVKFYRMIYVLIPGGMYCFDLITKNYKVFDIDSNMQYRHAIKAREMVEKGEEM